MIQNDIVLKHLKRKPITSLEAFKLYGITRLASRIHDLKEAGNKIEGNMVEVRTRYGWTKVKQYRAKK
jgi:hypothetical protein